MSSPSSSSSDDSNNEDNFGESPSENNESANVINARLPPLIPEDVDDDELIASICFSERYAARYENSNVSFHLGTLFNAFNQCQNKMLALYLHSDHSILTHAFCTRVLGSEIVKTLLEEHFVVWGWDLTFSNNKHKLSRSLRNHISLNSAVDLISIPNRNLPVLAVIMKAGSRFKVFNTTIGTKSSEDLLRNLNSALEAFREQQREEKRKQEERAQREWLKKEQDREYEESLKADIEKDKVKALQEEERKREEQEIEEANLRWETTKKETDAKNEAIRKEIEASLPQEPDEDKIDVIKIRFRTPKGGIFQRRFICDTPLKVLLDYLIVEGYSPTNHKVISGWPRRNLVSLDHSKTLKDLELCGQESMILEKF